MRHSKPDPPNLPQSVPVGWPAWWVSEAKREHFMQCPTCGHFVNCRDLDEVSDHNNEHHLPPLKC